MFKGAVALDAHAKGDMDGLESTGGTLDVSGLSLFLADVFEKKAGGRAQGRLHRPAGAEGVHHQGARQYRRTRADAC